MRNTFKTILTFGLFSAVLLEASVVTPRTASVTSKTVQSAEIPLPDPNSPQSR